VDGRGYRSWTGAVSRAGSRPGIRAGLQGGRRPRQCREPARRHKDS